MLWPVQNLQALAHWCDDLLINFGALDLDEELYENGNKQCRGEFDKETTADMQNNHMKLQYQSTRTIKEKRTDSCKCIFLINLIDATNKI